MERIELPGYGQTENEEHLQAILLYLLEDQSGLGSFFRAKLQEIVMRNCAEEVDLSSSWRIAEKDKIDLTIECANVVLLIELKWSAAEGAGQTELYEKVATCFYHDWKKIFLFITRDGDHPASRTWVPVRVVPSAKAWDSKVAIPNARATVKRHSSEVLSKTTGIRKIANLLGPDFPARLCERAESLTGIPHAVCREYPSADVLLERPNKDYSGGWYGAEPGPGRYLRLFERTMAETPEFYVASANRTRLPFVMSELLIDGLELRVKYHNCAHWEPSEEFRAMTLAKRRLFDAVKNVNPESLIWVPNHKSKHNNFHQKQLLSRRDFDGMQSQPKRLKATVLDRAGDFYRDLAGVYTEAGRDFLSRLAEYR